MRRSCRDYTTDFCAVSEPEGHWGISMQRLRGLLALALSMLLAGASPATVRCSRRRAAYAARRDGQYATFEQYRDQRSRATHRGPPAPRECLRLRQRGCGHAGDVPPFAGWQARGAGGCPKAVQATATSCPGSPRGTPCPSVRMQQAGQGKNGNARVESARSYECSGSTTSPIRPHFSSAEAQRSAITDGARVTPTSSAAPRPPASSPCRAACARDASRGLPRSRGPWRSDGTPQLTPVSLNDR